MSQVKSGHDKYPQAAVLNEVVCFEIVTATWANDGMPSMQEQEHARSILELRRNFKMMQPEEIVGISLTRLSFVGQAQDREVDISEPYLIPVSNKFSEISDNSISLLNMTRSEYERRAQPLPDALWAMRSWSMRTESLPVWACWGDFPARKVKRDAERVKCRDPFSSRMLNIKVLASLRIGLGVDLSLSQAVDEIEIVGANARSLRTYIGDAVVTDYESGARDVHTNSLVSAGVLAWSLL